MNFNDLIKDSDLLNVLVEMGYEKPTEIQEKAIPVLLETSDDFVGQAQTGTGKTAAFVLPLLSRIDFDLKETQALILAPTRELANQVEFEIKKFNKYKKITSTCIYGGTEYEPQLRELKRNPQIVVGTPGRVIDMIKKRALKLMATKYFVLDEADEMLTMGFFEEVQVILEKFRKKPQLIMFSATMPQPILKLIKSSFTNPEIVKIEKKSLSNDDIEQRYFVVRDKHFKEALARLIDHAQEMYGIVFCRTKLETKTVGDDLKKRGHSVEVLNGDMGQMERDHAMKNFKSKRVKILVCTDVAARGIDVNDLTHVFNFGPPRDNESYVHRIGRTGRAGTKGKAFTIVGPNSVRDIRNLEKHINKKIKKEVLPKVSDLIRTMVSREIHNARYIVEAINSKGADFHTDPSFELVEKEFGHLSKEEMMKLMFVWKFNKDMRHYNNLADIEKVTLSSSKPKKKKTNKQGIDARNRKN
jgi:ATP-dependent RNA helicase DeaD